MKTKWEQYQICVERGHTRSDTSFSQGSKTTYSCKWCGTVWWQEVVNHYSKEPKPPEEPRPVGNTLCPYCSHRIARIELDIEDDGLYHCNHCRGER